MIIGTRGAAVLPLAAATVAALVFLTAPAEAGEAELIAALTALRDHVNGTAPLSGSQIADYKLTIDGNRTIFGDSAATIQASFNLVSTYDSTIGPLWSAGSPTENGFNRPTVTNDIHWTVYNVMQNIMDDTYNSGNIQAHQSLLNGYKFGSADVFPGHVNPPADPLATYTVPIDGGFPQTFGRETQGWTLPARQATGAYLAPGTIATVTVPPSLVGQGYQIRVEGHSWDFSNKNPVDRLDRSSLLYDINSTQVQVASPLGGSLYIEVPYRAGAGVVNVQFQNVTRTPLFSMQSFHTTTLDDWRNVERNQPGPWADFQTDKFMMNVPTSWIYNLDDPVTVMRNWDQAMDVINDLMGFPRLRGKETMFPQVDVRMRASVYAPGYPSVNQTYDPLQNYGGTSSSHLVRGPQYAAYYEFHEQGHSYFFPKFPGETESAVNILHVAVWHQAFGYNLDYAFAASMGNQNNPHRTLNNAAVEWMASFNFVEKDAMAEAEKAYQLKGHAKFIEIARVFGWDKLGDYWRSYLEDDANGVSYSTDTDSQLLRLSKNVGKDITPLFAFYGVYAANPATLAANLRANGVHRSQEIYDLLVHYKTLVPANNADFRQYCLDWWERQPSVNGYWTESEHAKQWDNTYGRMYTEATAAAITAVIDDLIKEYYPSPYVIYDLGDLNLDHAVDGLDWQRFIAGSHVDLSGLAWKDAYLRGDLDGDGDNDIWDFAKFREAYELYHPEPGAFEAMVASYSAPEPSTVLLLAVGAATAAMWRWRRARW